MYRLLLLWALLPSVAWAQHLDSLHIMIDGEAKSNAPYVYPTFQAAASHFVDGVTVYIRPGVYWIDDPDDPTVRVGRDGREPFGMTIRCRHLTLIGQGQTPEDVVLASQRGQTQGAVGNFTMFDFWCRTLRVENLTMGNYCNVDLVYPRNPLLNRPKRSDAITQAHVGYVHGDTLTARRVRFISRLNLNPLNGARYSCYEDCHFECTDDALNGSAVYRDCHFDFYGQKPFWSTQGAGPLFINCLFNAKSDNRELYFCKQGGPVTLIDCRYEAPSDSVYIGWTAYPQPWLRCYQQNFTLNGKPYLVGARQPDNTLQPALLTRDMKQAPYLGISRHEATLQTERDTLLLRCPERVRWHVAAGYSRYVRLSAADDGTVVVVPTNDSEEIAAFCVVATTDDGREAACHLTVEPSPLPPPDVIRPRLRLFRDKAEMNYTLTAKAEADDSRTVWYRDSIPVAVTYRQETYQLQEADKGHVLRAVLHPKQKRSGYGEPVVRQARVKRTQRQHRMETDFHQLYCDWQPVVAEGLWTTDGYKPEDTAAFPWSFDRGKPMWEYAEGYNGAVGMGLLQAQRGARLMYTPVCRTYGDMSLTLEVDPTKTAGQGFGSATGQYMDICLKFDTHTLTGYGLRIIRTTKHAKAVDFLLVRYQQGQVSALTEPISSTCYRTGCTISIDFAGRRLRAHVETAMPQPAGSVLPHVVDLEAEVEPNSYGGLHIQHTGSCGESTSMLHHLMAEWQ